MTKQTALKVIIIISLAGIAFSGVLSYQELFLNDCGIGLVKCGVTGPIAGVPACVLGLIMYVAVFGIAYTGYRSKK